MPLKVDTCKHRRRNWRVCANELTALAERRDDIEIIVAEWGGDHADGYDHITRVAGTGEFNRSKALNAAASGASSDLICYMDIDMLLSPAEWDRAIDDAQQHDCYSPYKQLCMLGPRKTANRIADSRWQWELPLGNDSDVPRRKGGLAGGIFFCSRKFCEETGGWDARFIHWGYEDIAMCKVAERGNYRIGWGNADALHMYHPNKKRGRSKSRELLHTHYGKSRKINNVVLTSYFNHSRDPQRKTVWSGDFSEMNPLIESVTSKGIHCIVLSNCFAPLNDRLATVQSVAPDREFVPNVARWAAQLQWLKRNRPVRAFLVDATDVEMHNDPFPRMERGTIYVGVENKPVNNRWMKDQQARFLKIPDYRETLKPFLQERLLNVGVVGGYTADLIPMLEDLVALHERYSRGLASSSDTAMFHYNVFKNGYVKKIATSPSPQVTSEYKKYERQSNAWFKHK